MPIGVAYTFVLPFPLFPFILVVQATAMAEYRRKENMANMEKAQHYVKLLRDEILNDILNSPADEPTTEYLTSCLEEAYEMVLETIHAEAK